MTAPSSQAFLHALAETKLSNLETSVALLWWHGREDVNASRTATELVAEITAAGYPQQNSSRLRAALDADKRTARGLAGGFRIKIASRGALDERYGAVAGVRSVRKSDSVLPSELFVGTRGYLQKVVAQINASYDTGLYDCCSVMCRRLAETLVIEVYEERGWAVEIRDAEGNFHMFAGLLAVVERDASKLGIGRSGLKGLKDFKRIGDLSAHNRRYNARRDDIDRVRDGLRVATEELIELANYRNSA